MGSRFLIGLFDHPRQVCGKSAWLASKRKDCVVRGSSGKVPFTESPAVKSDSPKAKRSLGHGGQAPNDTKMDRNRPQQPLLGLGATHA